MWQLLGTDVLDRTSLLIMIVLSFAIAVMLGFMIANGSL